MKFNKLMVVCIFLLAIVTIGTASAADENITDTADEDVLSAEPVSEDLSADTADENAVEKTTGELSELQSLVDNTASGQTLYLDYDYTRNNNKRITISNAITIDGQGHTIDANKKGNYVFYVTNSDVVLKNINFINGGFAFVYTTSGKCSIYDSSFTGSSSEYYGGAIRQCNAYNCSFENCSAGFGGAIMDGSAYNCSFVDCSAVEDGGAIYGGDARNCSFVRCSAAHNGGAIFQGSAYNCSFVDCFADGYGGAIFLQGNAYDSSFINCTAKEGIAALNWCKASNCTFIDCKGFVAISKINATDIFVGSSDYNIVIYGDSYAGVKVEVTVNGETKKTSPSHSGAKVQFSGLDVGTYEVKVFYPGNANYEAQTMTTSFKVIERIPIHDIVTDYPYAYSEGHKDFGNLSYSGKNATLTFYNYVANVPGNYKVTVNGVSQNVKASNSGIPIPLGVLIGPCNITVSYAGSANFNAQTVSLAFNVIKADPIVSVSSPDVGYGEDAVIKIVLDKNAKGSVNVSVNNMTQNVKISSRTLNVKFSGLKIGSYNVTVSYPKNDEYDAQNMTSSFNVVKGTPIASGAVDPNPVGFGDDAIIKVNMLNSQINGNVWFTISDENKTKILTDKIHIENGIATQAISGLGLGKYYLHLYYAGNTHYNAQTVKGSFEVVKKTPIASVNVSNWAIDSDPTIKVKVNNVNGNIWFTVSDENKTQILTDKIHIEDGWAIVSVPNLKVGKYYLHIYYAGNVHYSAQTIKSSFEVTKISPELSVAKTTVDGKTVLTASVPEDARGNVKFEVNGTVYKAPIVKGVANLTLPDLAPGTYRLTSSYAGNYKYLAETKTRSITIK